MASLLQISSHFLLVFLYFSCACSYRKLDLGAKEVRTDPLLPSNDSVFFSGFVPSKSIQLSWHPRVFLYEGFISDEECAHLLSLANGKLDEASATRNGTGDGNISEVSSHNGFELARGQDEIISRIEERISAWTFLPNENGEDMQILHYRVNDSEPPHQYSQDNPQNSTGGPRIAAVLIFLSDVPHGGETIFPKSSKMQDSDTANRKEVRSECASSGLAVKHVGGNALLIFNLHPNGSVDESSFHGGCSVVEGEKWTAVKWIHVRAFDRKKVSSSDEAKEECGDEDDNCPQWAALGECEKNSVYMLGTPDYYGSCRKSCGVC